MNGEPIVIRSKSSASEALPFLNCGKGVGLTVHLFAVVGHFSTGGGLSQEINALRDLMDQGHGAIATQRSRLATPQLWAQRLWAQPVR